MDLKRSFNEKEIQNNNEHMVKLTIPEKSARKEENANKENDKSLSLNFEKDNIENMSNKKAELTPGLRKEVFTLINLDFFLKKTYRWGL